jgi:hypothetical protein
MGNPFLWRGILGVTLGSQLGRIAGRFQKNKYESGVRAIAEYAAHYHGERSHQGIGNAMIGGAARQSEGSTEVSERLGGLLKYYHRRVA